MGGSFRWEIPLSVHTATCPLQLTIGADARLSDAVNINLNSRPCNCANNEKAAACHRRSYGTKSLPWFTERGDPISRGVARHQHKVCLSLAAGYAKQLGKTQEGQISCWPSFLLYYTQNSLRRRRTEMPVANIGIGSCGLSYMFDACNKTSDAH